MTDDNFIINKIIDILNSNNRNLVLGNISNPRPNSICPVNTSFGMIQAYNINCTYPGNACVVWDKDENRYYCFTTKPSEILDSKKLVYRKNREITKLEDKLYTILYKKESQTNVPVNGSFNVSGDYGATGNINNFSGTSPSNITLTNSNVFNYPSTISVNSSITKTSQNKVFDLSCYTDLSLNNVWIAPCTITLNVTFNYDNPTTLSTADQAYLLAGLSVGGVQLFINSPNSVSSTKVITVTEPTLFDCSMGMYSAATYPTGSFTANLSASMTISGIKYTKPYDLYLQTSKSKSIKLNLPSIALNDLVKYSLVTTKDKVFFTLKKNKQNTYYQIIVKQIYNLNLKLLEEYTYTYNQTIPNNDKDWLNIYNISYSSNPILPEYINSNLDNLSNLPNNTTAIKAEIRDSDKSKLSTQDLKLPVNLYTITLNPYTTKLKKTTVLVIKKIVDATLLAISIFK